MSRPRKLLISSPPFVSEPFARPREQHGDALVVRDRRRVAQREQPREPGRARVVDVDPGGLAGELVRLGERRLVDDERPCRRSRASPSTTASQS